MKFIHTSPYTGISYGGYATLVGLTFTPDVFRCGIDADGPANLITLLEAVSDDNLDGLVKRLGGDLQSEEGR